MKELKTKTSWVGGLALLSVGWIVVAYLLVNTLGRTGSLISSGIALFAILFLLLETFNRVRDVRVEQLNHDRQLQALLNLRSLLKPEVPFPTMRMAALSPDTGLEYFNLIRAHRPKVIVELGSGVSTLIAGIQLKRHGEGKVIALDHDAGWLELTRQMIADNNVEGPVDLRHAPLVSVEGAQHIWYDPKALEDVNNIDLLLIDGPPDYDDRGTRLPGLTHLLPKLSQNAVIVADDCIRPNWYNKVVTWAKENQFEVIEPFQNEKRSLILKRK